jgi:hypothetical protein
VESTILDFMTEEEVDKLLRGFDLDVTFGPVGFLVSQEPGDDF